VPTSANASAAEAAATGGKASPDPNGQAGPLAEFEMLRSEIVARITLQHQIVLLQLSASGATISLVLAKPELAAILLFLPEIGYLLVAHYASLDKPIVDSATYIEQELHDKVDGGLKYEGWLRKSNLKLGNATRQATNKRQRWINPLHLTFPLVSAFGLVAGLALIAYGKRQHWSYFREHALLTVGYAFLLVLGTIAVIFGLSTVRQVASNHDDEAIEESRERTESVTSDLGKPSEQTSEGSRKPESAE
jgi:hypothetical protein